MKSKGLRRRWGQTTIWLFIVLKDDSHLYKYNRVVYCVCKGFNDTRVTYIYTGTIKVVGTTLIEKGKGVHGRVFMTNT